MPSNSYDVIVLGDEFPGVVAATLCASRGMRVLLASTRSEPESYAVGPYRLPTRPLAFVGLDSPAVKRVMEELNFTHLLRRRLRDNTPPFQFIGPDARIDVGPDEHALLAELARDVSPDGGDQMAALLGRVAEASALLEPLIGQPIVFPPVGFWERREIGRHEEPLAATAAAALAPEGSFAAALLGAPAALSAFAPIDALSPTAIARSFELWRRGTAQLPGGREALRGIFLDKFTSHGGEVRKVAVESISLGWGKATGVVLKDGEELGAEHVIAALPLDGVQRLIPKEPKRLAQLASHVTTAGYRYTLNLVIAEAGIPEGLGSTALVVVDPALPLAGDNAFAIHVGEPDDEAKVTVTLEAVCPKPPEGTTLGDAFAALRRRLRVRLEDVMPFSGPHVLVAHSPHEGAPPEGVAAVAELEAPARPLPVWRSGFEATLGLTGAPYQLGIKRLTLASTQIMPGLGLEGELATGWCAARLADGGGKKRDYLQETRIPSTSG